MLHSELLASKAKAQTTGVVSLGLEGAYNSVNADILIEILINLKVPPKITKFIYNLIRSRNIYGYYNGIKFASGWTNKGLPQGSCLSPLLFNRYIHYAVNTITREVGIIEFADDIILYSSGFDVDQITVALEYNVFKLYKFFKQINLSLNPEKCALIYFNNPNLKNNTMTINISGQLISNSSDIKYLGIRWQSNLE